jgi:hypothetical protein
MRRRTKAGKEPGGALGVKDAGIPNQNAAADSYAPRSEVGVGVAHLYIGKNSAHFDAGVPPQQLAPEDA